MKMIHKKFLLFCKRKIARKGHAASLEKAECSLAGEMKYRVKKRGQAKPVPASAVGTTNRSSLSGMFLKGTTTKAGTISHRAASLQLRLVEVPRNNHQQTDTSFFVFLAAQLRGGGQLPSRPRASRCSATIISPAAPPVKRQAAVARRPSCPNRAQARCAGWHRAVHRPRQRSFHHKSHGPCCECSPMC